MASRGRKIHANGRTTVLIGLLLLYYYSSMLKVEGRSSCIETERKALLALRADNPNAGLVSTWRGEDYCNWSGVHCDNTTGGHVTELHLRCPDVGTAGSTRCLNEVTPSLLGLTRLKYLDLSLNNFTKFPIAEFMGSLVNLEYLNLSSVPFNGTFEPSSDGIQFQDLHWLFRIPSLRYLDLSGNDLSNATNWIHDVNKLTSLKVLRLSASKLHSIPAALPHLNLSSLVTLDLSSNSFGSPIPRWLFNISSLENLFLDSCGFYGRLPIAPPYISLLTLSLSGNSFKPTVPPWLFNASTLERLYLEGNHFNGVTSEGGCSSNLRVLDLSNNKINNINQETLVKLIHLEHLDLSSNAIPGEIPETIGNLSHLKYLNISVNEIGGEIPKSLWNLRNLVLLDFDNNNISGRIPESIGNLHKLRELHMAMNMIDGVIPETIGNLSRLQALSMMGNKISGRIPETMGKLLMLQILDLSDNNIDGEIPRSIGSLCALIVLNLSQNRIGGEITHLVQGLSKCISSSGPDGNNTTSWSWDLGGLQILRLGKNRLKGGIPKSLGQLHKLHALGLAYNSLTGTLVEDHFANLTSLTRLYLSYNHLVVNVSQSWVPPFQLSLLGLCSCQLGPEFPAWLQSQKGLFSIMCLSEAGISGEIPAWFFQLGCEDGCYFDVSHNQMKGRLPPSLGSHKYGIFDVSSNSFEGPIPNLDPSLLKFFYLSHNLFSGVIPLSFAAAVGLISFATSDNRINGTIPSFFCEMTSLEFLDLSNNDLAGGIPQCWNNSRSPLRVIDLSNNSLSGEIPHSIGSLTRLESLHLRNNGLFGEIPLSLKYCERLVLLDIGENMLSGRIPSWIGESFSTLAVLRLRSNLFDGSIPVQLTYLAYLQVLDLADNNLSGYLSPSFGNLGAMVAIRNRSQSMPEINSHMTSIFQTSQPVVEYYYLENLLVTAKGMQLEYTKMLSLVTSMDLSSNRLSGEIPEELTNLHVLHFLNLSGNQFTGRIPGNIGAMGQLESLDLSNNNLSGSIPSNMSDLNFLSRLNLSNNDLSGRIPSGKQLQTLSDPSIYGGNRDLCGWPLVQCDNGDAPSRSPTHTGDQEDEDAGSETIWIYAGSALGFVVGFWAFVGTVIIKRSVRYAYFRCIDNIQDRVYFCLSNGR